MDIRAAVIHGAEKMEEGKFCEKQRASYINASEAMTCIRKQWYSKFKPELAEEQDWGCARRGSHGEKYLVETLQQEGTGLNIYYTGDMQLSLQDEERRISATPDGLIQIFDEVNGDEFCGIEFKTIDPRTNINYLPKQPHVVQLQIAMALMNNHPEIPVQGKEIKRGFLVYMDASNFNKIYQYEVEVDPHVLDRVARRAARLFRADSAGVLDKEGKRDGGKECKTMCSFSSQCIGEQEEADATIDLVESVSKYNQFKRIEEDARTKKGNVAEDIKKAMKASNLSYADTGGHSVKIVTIKGRESLDKKALSSIMDLAPYMKQGKQTERLTITERTEK